MNAFFTGSTRNLEKIKDVYQKIISILEDSQIEIQRSWLIEKLEGTDMHTSSKDILVDNINLLAESDFAIVELSTPSLGVGYFIGQAIANHKKILCLYPDSINDDEISEVVSGSTSSLLTYKKYSTNNLESIIKEFIDSLQREELRKFNFVANEKIIDYLEKGADKENKSMSEFLRDKILKELIEEE